jgi:hypothetical protein
MGGAPDQDKRTCLESRDVSLDEGQKNSICYGICQKKWRGSGSGT